MSNTIPQWGQSLLARAYQARDFAESLDEKPQDLLGGYKVHRYISVRDGEISSHGQNVG